MTRALVGIRIPEGLPFSELNLRSEGNGELAYDRDAIERIMWASGIPPGMVGDWEEFVSSLIVAWYRAHLDAGGEPDPLMSRLILEVELEEGRLN